MEATHCARIDRSHETIALILAGGNGTRLGELTAHQCKPALAFAGSFRNIDFTLSNCVNSAVRRVAVLTQYKAQSLLAHIAGGWSSVPQGPGEFIDVWPAQQRTHTGCYTGTADAVQQNIDFVLAQGTPYTLVLAGDHIYKMDYRQLLDAHADSGADVTVSCVPVPIERAGAFGVLTLDEHRRVASFIEKPAPCALAAAHQTTLLASMGIYAFSTHYLAEALRADAANVQSAHDFGRDILPVAVRGARVQAHLFLNRDGRPGYWRDVGTPEAYWQAHMELLEPQPQIDLYDPDWPMRARRASVAPAKVCAGAQAPSYVSNSLLAGGAIVRGATVTNSVLAHNVRVDEASTLDEAVVLPNARIGGHCRLRRVIVADGTEIPDGTVLGWASAERLTMMEPRITLVTRDSVTAALRSVA